MSPDERARGGPARRFPGPETRPSPARARSSGSARGPARVARDARSGDERIGGRREPRAARSNENRFSNDRAKTAAARQFRKSSGSSGAPLPERDRARRTKPLFQLQNTHPSLLLQDAPRLPRTPLKIPRKPSRRSIDPPVDRATCRASDDASRSLDKKQRASTVARFLSNAAADDDGAARLRRHPTEKHHEAITKRSVRSAERALLSPARIEERAEHTHGRSVSSSAEARSSSSSSSRLVAKNRFRVVSIRRRARRRARPLARAKPRGEDVPEPATGSVDRGRLDSVTLSICPCVFENGSARQRPGATRVADADASDDENA